jgi:hypothetical protein
MLLGREFFCGLMVNWLNIYIGKNLLNLFTDEERYNNIRR